MGIGVESNSSWHGLCQHDDLRCLRQLGKRNETTLRGAALSGLPQNKLDPIQWSMRPVMQVMGATTPKPYI